MAATRRGYEQAQQAFSRGDKTAALDLMNTAYLEHFERVEPWLDQRVSQDYREQVEAAGSRQQFGDDFGVARGLEADAFVFEAAPQRFGIGQVAVVGDRDRSQLGMLDHDRLRVLQPV